MVTRRASAGQRSWQRFTVTVTQSAKAAQSAAKELCMAHWHASTAKSVAPTRGATGHFTSGYSTSPFQLHCYCLWFWFGLEPCTAAIKKYFNNSTQKLIRKRCNCRSHGEVPPCLSQHKPLQHLHTSAHTVLVTIWSSVHTTKSFPQTSFWGHDLRQQRLSLGTTVCSLYIGWQWQVALEEDKRDTAVSTDWQTKWLKPEDALTIPSTGWA